jgi:hypothetical protein
MIQRVNESMNDDIWKHNVLNFRSKNQDKMCAKI